MSFDADVYEIRQLIRPVVNLYQVEAGGTPVCFVRQKRMKLREDIGFFADESQTDELFRLKARSVIEVHGRYDVVATGGEPIGVLQKVFGKSLLRSTWRVLDPSDKEVAIARERSLPVAILRRGIEVVPYVGPLIPVPYNFEIVSGDKPLGSLTRAFGKIRDQYALDLSGDPERTVDRRLAIALAIALDTLQNR